MRDRTRRKKLSLKERLTRRKTHRLAAHVSREDQWDYEVPNIRLSRAFVVVVVLHVVAVGGILIFEVLKPDGNGSKSLASSSGTLDAGQSYASATPEGVKIGDPRTEGMDAYIVRAGDTLDSIASSFKVRRETIERQNGLDAGGRIYPGRSLFIPKSDISDPRESAGRIAAAGAGNAGGLNADPQTPAERQRATSEQDAYRVADVTPPTYVPPARPQPVTPQPEPERARPQVTERVAPTPVAPTPVAPTPVAPEPVRPVSGRDGGTYTMVRGDTPYSIARKYGVNVQALLKANGIKDPTTIQIGQTLRIPGRR